MEPSSVQTDLPIVVGEDVYSGTDQQQCFVLVDDRTVGVMPRETTVHHLITTQDGALEVESGRSKTLEMVHMEEKGAVEMVHMEEKGMVEMVHMEDKGIVDMVHMENKGMIEMVHMEDKGVVEMVHMPEKGVMEVTDLGERDGVDVIHIDSKDSLDIVHHVEGKDTLEMMHMSSGRTVEVLHMDDGKTVEVVQMDGGKTLEVMHIDANKHTEVIQVESGANVELIRDNDMVPLATASNSIMLGGKKKGKCLLSDPDHMNVKQIITSGGNTSGLSLSSIASVTPSIVLSTSKSGLITSQSFAHVAPQPSFHIGKKSHSIGTTALPPHLSHVKANILFSDTKQVLSSGSAGLNNTIIISWPTLEPEPENTVATQTDPHEECGPSMNLFFCTFYADNTVQTQCDMPSYRDKSMCTGSTGECGDHTVWWDSDNQAGDQGVNIKDKEGCSGLVDQRYSRSGRILKGKGPLFNPEEMEEDRNAITDPDFQTEDAEHQSLALRKKRGRKRKKRLPSPDNFEEEFQLGNGDEKETEDDNTLMEVKEEPLDLEDEEVAMEVLKKKGYGLRTKRRLKKLSDMHYIQEKVIKKRIDRTQEFSCQVCPRVFPTFSKLQRHAKEVHDSTDFSFPCDVCGVVFTRPHNLERHKDTKHSDGERRFVCEHCGRRFARQDVLSVHISMVHLKRTLQGKKGNGIIGPNTFHCTSCDKFFSKEQRLKEHRQGNLNCADCALSFECKTSLRVHQYKHHPTACSECGKVCDNKQQMYFHRLSHTPKFVCKFCNKGFLWKSQYTVHMATHTGERPVLCDICGKSFAHKMAVRKHKWQEHNENNKKYKCDRCNKTFVYRGKLQSHMRSHTGEKPFTCNNCTSTFSQRCNLMAHIKSVHGVYIQSIKSDGTTHMQLVKYKRTKKQAPQLPEPASTSQADTVNTVITPDIVSPAPDQTHQMTATIQDQVQMSESFETEAAVYQIVYTSYPQGVMPS